MGPQFSFAERMELILRLSVPYSFLALLFICNIISVPYPLAAFFRAPLLLMGLYYWCIYRPTLLPPALVFAVGIAHDLITGAPYFGLMAVLFLLCRMALLDQRRFLMGQNFIMLWVGFGVVALIFFTLQWLIFSALSVQWLPIKEIITTYLLGMVLFPPLYLMLNMTHKFLPAPIRKKSPA